MGITLHQRRWLSWTFCGGLLMTLLAYTGCTSRQATPPQQPIASGAVQKTQPKPYKALGKWYTPMAEAKDFRQQGRASWYGKKFHGRKTANGEVYDMYGISAAHKTLPFGTFVRVNNLNNDKSLVVRINDRGPFIKGRIIDLSYGAAAKLGLVGPGTAEVEIVALGAATTDASGGETKGYIPIDYYSGNFTFQVGAFRARENAERLLAKLDRIYKNAHLTTYQSGSQTFYRVRVGRANNLEEATEFENILLRHGFEDVFTVAE